MRPSCATAGAAQSPRGRASFELERLARCGRRSGRPAGRSRAAAITCGRMLGIGVDDGGAARRQQLGEQAQLGGEVGFHGRVIVEVVAAEIGEGRRLQPDAVEPVLVEAVRGGFEGEVRDALGRQLGQGLVQRDGIGRGQAAVDAAVGLDEADGAERGGLVAERGEDLPREVGDRGLAAGAGDGDDRLGLRADRSAPPSAPARGAARRRAARARASGTATSRACADEHRRPRPWRPPRHEARAVRLGSRQRREQPAGPHLAAVGRDAGDFDTSAATGRSRHRRLPRAERAGALAPSQPVSAACVALTLTADRRVTGFLLCGQTGRQTRPPDAPVVARPRQHAEQRRDALDDAGGRRGGIEGRE